MAVTIRKLVELLNKYLELEYSAGIQYVQHLRNILSVEQEHAMDLFQALGRPHAAADMLPVVSGAATH
ncbi:MAG: hypothetical protein J7M40_12410 [Planctomycetes bacterium]|nr:hypothetical protein [Planctomycetota bacterium]